MSLLSLQAQLKRIHLQERRLQAKLAFAAKAEKERLIALPRQAGFRSVDELVQALLPLVSKRRKARRPGPVASAAVTKKVGRKRPAGGYSSELKAAVKSELVKGGKTAEAIAKAHGISVPTVNVWKKGWGLVKSPKKSR